MAFFHTPGLKIVYPSTARDAKGLLKAAIRDDDPVLYFEHKKLYRAPFLRETLTPDDAVEPLGRARLHRAGSDLTIITYGMMVHESQRAADMLAADGIEVEIVDLRTLRPLDMEPVLESFRKTNRAVVVEEGWRSYGVGSEIASRIYEEAFDYVDAPILRVAQKEVPLPYNRELEQMALPQASDIVAAVKEVMK